MCVVLHTLRPHHPVRNQVGQMYHVREQNNFTYDFRRFRFQDSMIREIRFDESSRFVDFNNRKSGNLKNSSAVAGEGAFFFFVVINSLLR